MIKDRINLSMMNRFNKFKTKKIDYSITLLKTYNKHKGVCQECKRLTVLGVHPPQNNSATMEHKIPLSCGGNHTWDNVTLLCQYCNNLNNSIKIDESKVITNKTIKLLDCFGFVLYYIKGK